MNINKKTNKGRKKYSYTFSNITLKNRRFLANSPNLPSGRFYRDVLQCVAVHCSVLQCVAVCFGVFRCVTMCCSVLSRVAVSEMISGQYSELPSVRIYSDLSTNGMGPDRSCSKVLLSIMTLQYTATHCNIFAIHCNILQYIATHCNTLQHTATHCYTLQHTATQCNTLQHTATRCNTLQHAASNCASFAPRTSLILSIRASPPLMSMRLSP